MIVKILSLIDLLFGLNLILYVQNGFFESGLVVLLLLSILKAVFTIKDFFSKIDLLLSIIAAFSFFGLGGIVIWFIAGWFFIKGLFGLVSSV